MLFLVQGYEVLKFAYIFPNESTFKQSNFTWLITKGKSFVNLIMFNYFTQTELCVKVRQSKRGDLHLKMIVYLHVCV